MIEKLFSLDLPSLIIGIFILMSATMAIVDLIGKFSSVIGKPVRWIRKKNEDHDLLMTTIHGLNTLQAKHDEDVKQSIRHDELIKNEVAVSVKEIQKSLQAVFNSNSARDDQISALMVAQREALADRINQKYKYYISVKGIPEDEVDEFTNLHIAYKCVGGNHSGDAKYNYCINHLPVIPVEVKLKLDEKKEAEGE